MNISIHSRRFIQLANLSVATLFFRACFLPITTFDNSAFKSHKIHNQAYLIAANHRRGFDPFVITSAIPYRDYLRISPINFMTKNAIYYSPIRPFAWLFGCFPAKPKGQNPYFGVEGSVALLMNRVSIFVFPEGRCIKDGRKDAVPHHGIIRIHEGAPTVPMILCHIEYNGISKIWQRNVFSVSFKIIGKPDYSDPQDVMNDIFAIPLTSSK